MHCRPRKLDMRLRFTSLQLAARPQVAQPAGNPNGSSPDQEPARSPAPNTNYKLPGPLMADNGNGNASEHGRPPSRTAAAIPHAHQAHGLAVAHIKTTHLGRHPAVGASSWNPALVGSWPWRAMIDISLLLNMHCSVAHYYHSLGLQHNSTER